MHRNYLWILFVILITPKLSEAETIPAAPALASGQVASGFKIVLLLKNNTSLSPDEFSRSWINARKTDNTTTGLLRQVYNEINLDDEMRIKTEGVFGFSGVEEMWFESREAAFIYISNFQEQLRKDDTFSELIDPAGTVMMGGECSLIISTPQQYPDRRVKIMIFGVRRAGMSDSEYRNYWIEHHGALVRAAPNSYNNQYRVEYCPIKNVETAGFSRTPYDGLASIEFHNPEALKSTLENEYYRQVLAQDEPNFSDRQKSFGARVAEQVIYQAQ
jgi:hypothetical protein